MKEIVRRKLTESEIKEFQSLCEQYNNLKDDLNKGHDIINVFTKDLKGIKGNSNLTIKVKRQLIVENTKDMKERKKLSRKSWKQIEVYKATCAHDWWYKGHGHNDDMYKCNICNEIKWE